MSNLEKQSQNRGLGRGLGSLFGSELAQDNVNALSDETATAAPAAVPATPAFEEKTETKAAAPEVIVKEVIKEVIREQEIPEESRIWQIPVEKLKVNNYQPRRVFDKDKISELSASIKEQGILQPIVARKSIKGDYEIIAGERRWRAAQQAGLHEVPVILKDIDDQKSLELALIENIQRENLNPIEEADAYEQLAREFHLTQQQISEKVGKDRATVANTLRLLTLVSEVKTMLMNGEISVGHAKALLAIQDPTKQKEVAKMIASEKLTVRAAEKLIKKATKVKDETLRDETMDSLIEIMADELQKTLGTKVKIDYTDGAGKITIHYYSDTELTQITDRMKGTWKPSNETTL
jgi:ParB family chromosome partitioning protein